MGGREKAPAAICRKVIEAKLSGDHRIEIWGDGEQTRSYMQVRDCVEGSRRIMDSDIAYPINLGSSELVSVNQLVSVVEGIAGVELARSYDLSAPQGVRGRNSDNTLIKQELDWEPSIALQEGIEELYAWIYQEMTSEQEAS
jgi:nucleoside-diphosphate-sugar epimerase